MEKIFEYIPRSIFPFVVLAVGVLAFYLIHPPKSKCEAQRSNFMSSLRGAIYPSSFQGKSYPPRVVESRRSCQATMTLGGCAEYFDVMKKVVDAVKDLRSDCYANILEDENILKVLENAYLLSVRLAWGDEPPADFSPGWLSDSQLYTFCSIGQVLKATLPEEEWQDIARSAIRDLPGELGPAPDDPQKALKKRKAALEILKPTEVIRRSLLSYRCQAVL